MFSLVAYSFNNASKPLEAFKNTLYLKVKHDYLSFLMISEKA